MKRKLIVLTVIVAIFVVLQGIGTGIGMSRSGGGRKGSLKQVKREHPQIKHMKDGMNRLFDTRIDLGQDMRDPSGDWDNDDSLKIRKVGSRSLVIRASRRAIRILRLRNDEDDVTVSVSWTPRADPNAAWWDITAKKFPVQSFQIRPEGEQTIVALKGGGTLSFQTKGNSDDAKVEFLVDE